MTEEKGLQISLAELDVLLDAAIIASRARSDVYRYERYMYQQVVEWILGRMKGIPVLVDGGGKWPIDKKGD